MYMREPKRTFSNEKIPAGVAAVLTLAVAGTIYLGLFPNRIMDLATQAAAMLH